MPNLAEEAAFADAAYAKHAHELIANPTFLRKYTHPSQMWDWRQWGAQRLGSVAGCTLLDYGCGAGEEAIYFAKLGAHVTAIDISPGGVQLARDRAAANGVSVDARVMRCDPTTFPAQSFDVIHGFGILHHVGLETGLREVQRLLKPGGRGLFFEHMGNSRLIEWAFHRGEDYTSGEQPVRWRDVQAEARQRFRLVECRAFHLLSRLRYHVAAFQADGIKRFDAAALAILPPLRYFASGIVIYVER